ncbi:MAG TPA: hypothetical protein VGY77_08660, partial [Gemmataceae bacterium]|nr:hypothetical protein [Gemmataceae bacterium]
MRVLRRSGRNFFFGFIFVVLIGTGIGPVVGAEPAIEAEDLRSGLVATYRDTETSIPAEVTQLDPIMALSLKANETPHPRLAAGGGKYRWEGYLYLIRPGAYRFRAQLQGKFQLRIDGREVFAAEVKDSVPVLKESPEIKFESGVHSLKAEFTRLAGPARLELFWKSSFFGWEPMGHEPLGHLPKKVPTGLSVDQSIERGRFLAEEFNCAKCHQPKDKDNLARGLQFRPGPDLSRVGERVHPGWIFRWLEAPDQVRPGALMPRMFSDDETGRVERYVVAKYLESLGGPVPLGKPPGRNEIKAAENRGQKLFTRLGCVACHATEQRQEQTEARPRSFYTLANPDGQGLVIPLTGLGSKTTPEKLAKYLENPLAVDPSGRMPHMLLQNKEAHDLAWYLCQSKDLKLEKDLIGAPEKKQLVEIFR